MTKTCFCDLYVSNLEHLKFGFVSNFVLRYSNLQSLAVHAPKDACVQSPNLWDTFRAGRG